MTLNIKVSAALAEKHSLKEQSKILSAIETGQHLDTARLYEGALKVKAVYEEWGAAVEGYAGFPVDRDEIKKKKDSMTTVMSDVSSNLRVNPMSSLERKQTVVTLLSVRKATRLLRTQVISVLTCNAKQ